MREEAYYNSSKEKLRMMRPQFRQECLGAVDEVIQDLARERRGIISDEAKTFIVNVIDESLRARIDEWERLDFQVDRLKSNIRTMLDGAAHLPQYETGSPDPVVSLISIIDWVRQNWCKVFPFCR